MPTCAEYAWAGTGVAGLADGPVLEAQFNYPQDIAFSPDGTTAYVADWGNNLVRYVDMETQVVSGGFAISEPFRIRVRPNGNLLISYSLNTIGEFTPAGALIRNIVASGQTAYDFAVDDAEQYIYWIWNQGFTSVSHLVKSDFATGAQIWHTTAFGNFTDVLSCALSPEQDMFYVAFGDFVSNVQAFDIDDGSYIGELNFGGTNVAGIDVNGYYLVSAGVQMSPVLLGGTPVTPLEWVTIRSFDYVGAPGSIRWGHENLYVYMVSSGLYTDNFGITPVVIDWAVHGFPGCHTIQRWQLKVPPFRMRQRKDEAGVGLTAAPMLDRFKATRQDTARIRQADW